MASTGATLRDGEATSVMRKRVVACEEAKGSESEISGDEDDASASAGSLDGESPKLRPYTGDWDNYKVEPRESSGVTFHPHPRYWLVGGKWYDLEPFLLRHPGGPRILLEARNRFNDCTFAFEAHHHNYKKTRAVLSRYEVKGDLARRLTVEREAAVAGGFCGEGRGSRVEGRVARRRSVVEKARRGEPATHRISPPHRIHALRTPPPTTATIGLNPQDLITQEEIEASNLASASKVERDRSFVHGGYDVKLAADDSFYSVLRRRVTTYLRKNGGAGPTTECLVLFWLSWFSWVACWWHMYFSGSVAAAVVVGL